MDLLLLILFGGIIGWLASIVMKTGGGILWNVIIGILGSLVGGFIMNQFGVPGVTGFNIYSILVGVIGAVVLIFLSRLLRRA